MAYCYVTEYREQFMTTLLVIINIVAEVLIINIRGHSYIIFIQSTAHVGKNSQIRLVCYLTLREPYVNWGMKSENKYK